MKPDEAGLDPSSASFSYKLFGLEVLSELALPELPAIEGSARPDVVIRLASLGSPEETTAGPMELRDTERGAFLKVPEVGSYLIVGGSVIQLEPDRGASDRDVRLFLLGSAFGALLHQRGLLPLHANSIEIDNRAVGFLGHSGAGKSTLAAYFHRRGYRVLSDDVSVVRFDARGLPLAEQGVPRLRLWGDAARELGWTDLSEPVSERFDKFHFATGSGPLEACPLHRLYLLKPNDGLPTSFKRLTGADAIAALVSNTYRGAYVPILGQSRSHWENCLRLVEKTDIFEVPRAGDHQGLDQQVRALLHHLR